MPIAVLSPRLEFPDPRDAGPRGIVAIGGDLSPERLLLAYASGIFPWPSHGMPLAWYSPNPRWLLPPGELHVSRSLRKTLRRRPFRITFDRAFSQVIAACRSTPRSAEHGTWITNGIVSAYTELHGRGWAHSVEAWQEDRLVGGLYGVSIGAMFCGESMFHLVDDASKAAFVALAERLLAWEFDFIDCQVHTPHMEKFGARPVMRSAFLTRLASAVRRPSRQGPWTVEEP